MVIFSLDTGFNDKLMMRAIVTYSTPRERTGSWARELHIEALSSCSFLVVRRLKNALNCCMHATSSEVALLGYGGHGGTTTIGHVKAPELGIARGS
jgi:hypothetical protein